jgi:hypothetical protein
VAVVEEVASKVPVEVAAVLQIVDVQHLEVAEVV